MMWTLSSSGLAKYQNLQNITDLEGKHALVAFPPVPTRKL